MRGLALAGLCLLAGCGDLPQPFLGRPGATAMRLSQPPPSRLDIPLPADSLLTDSAAKAWSSELADALVAQELPAFAIASARKADWRLVLTAELKGGMVVPTYTVMNPQGVPQGASQGQPVPASEWAAGQPATFKAAAESEAPKVVALLGGIEARRQMSDPHSLLNRPPVLYLKAVTGAPGDGNAALTRLMATQLPHMGDVVQDTPKGADFTVTGEVKTAPGAGKTTRVEIQWVVTDEHGQERGRVVQLNEVKAGSLDQYWGEVAEVVADEASGGVRDVVVQAVGRADASKLAKPASGG